jgi:hypothetical protein
MNSIPYTGLEAGTPLDSKPDATFFDFTTDKIRHLLDRPGALGIRFHLNQDRPTPPTELYAAACTSTSDIRDTTVNNQDYFIPLPAGRSCAFENLPLHVAANFQPGHKVGGCVFFSRAILEGGILGPASRPNNVATVRFFVLDFGATDSLGVACTTLAAVGLDSGGNPAGAILRSEQPCPPVCPTDPDNPYGRD